MPLEKDARAIIDQRLQEAGWLVQDYGAMDVRAGVGVAVWEFPLNIHEFSLLTGQRKGFADYLLVVHGEALGVLEAKREGVTLSSVGEQSALYQGGLPTGSGRGPRFLRTLLPFSYEATNNEIQFKNGLEPNAKSREVQFFHRPETFTRWLWLAPLSAAPQDYNLLRTRLHYKMPPLLRVGQHEQ